MEQISRTVRFRCECESEWTIQLSSRDSAYVVCSCARVYTFASHMTLDAALERADHLKALHVNRSALPLEIIDFTEGDN